MEKQEVEKSQTEKPESESVPPAPGPPGNQSAKQPPAVERQQVEPPQDRRPLEQELPPKPQVDQQKVEPAKPEPEPAEGQPPVEKQRVDTPSLAREVGKEPGAGWLPGLHDWTGILQTSYRLRATHQENDQDLNQTALIQWGDPRLHRVTFTAQSRFWFDLDERPGTSALVSVTDTFDDRLQGQLLRGHLDFHRMSFLDVVRVGRQEIFSLPEVPLIDGVFVETAHLGQWRTRLRAFGGVPVHLWESSPSGDSIFGGGLEVEPLDGSWAAVEVGRVRDTLALSTERNEYGILRARQRLSENVAISGVTTFLEGNFRDYEIRGNALEWDGTLGINVSFFHLLKTQRFLTAEFDPYFQTLGDERPYTQLRALAWKDFGERFTVETGFWVRELVDDDDEGLFNHEFLRAHLTPTLRWPELAAEVSVTGETWKADDQSYRTFGAVASKTFAKRFRLELGTEYSLYKFNDFLSAESEDVRTWFVRSRVDLGKYGVFRLDLNYERDDRDTYRTVYVNYTWRF